MDTAREPARFAPSATALSHLSALTPPTEPPDTTAATTTTTHPHHHNRRRRRRRHRRRRRRRHHPYHHPHHHLSHRLPRCRHVEGAAVLLAVLLAVLRRVPAPTGVLRARIPSAAHGYRHVPAYRHVHGLPGHACAGCTRVDGSAVRRRAVHLGLGIESGLGLGLGIGLGLGLG